MKTFGNAKFVDCPGVTTDGLANHAQRDGCWSCAPFWERIPVCPTDGRKLTEHGFCRTCRKHFTLEDVSVAKAQ